MAESQEEKILDALESALAEITHANGYETDVGRVSTWNDDIAFSQPGGGRASIVTGDIESEFEPELNDASSNDSDWRIALRLWGLSDARKRVGRFIADVRKRLHTGAESDEWSGVGVLDLSVRRATRFVGDLDNDDVVGAALLIGIQWRDRKVDPYSLAGTAG